MLLPVIYIYIYAIKIYTHAIKIYTHAKHPPKLTAKAPEHGWLEDEIFPFGAISAYFQGQTDNCWF